MPPQHNPYAQSPGQAPGQPGQVPGQVPPPPPGQPGAPGVPGAGPYGGMMPGPGYYMPPQPAGAPGGGRRGGAGRAVLWAVVGAVVASAAWAGGVLLLRDDSSDKADLRGYTVHNDLCAIADLSAFDPEYSKGDDSPTKYTTTGDALDDMSCSEGLERSDSTYADAYVYVEVQLHKKTDPAPEFADTWLGYEQRTGDSYVVTPVSGFGDEAYLVTQDTISSYSGDRYVTLAVRDGWMTYSLNWNEFGSSSSLDSDSDTDDVPSVTEATQWVKTATKATLAKLNA